MPRVQPLPHGRGSVWGFLLPCTLLGKVIRMAETDLPFVHAPRRRWCPSEMTWPPFLNPTIAAREVRPRYALLVNPFYPKDPNASFGRRVLTPTLALTSFAATTPEHWEVRYWDENLLDGRPPFESMPEVVGSRCN